MKEVGPGSEVRVSRRDFCSSRFLEKWGPYREVLADTSLIYPSPSLQELVTGWFCGECWWTWSWWWVGYQKGSWRDWEELLNVLWDVRQRGDFLPMLFFLIALHYMCYNWVRKSQKEIFPLRESCPVKLSYPSSKCSFLFLRVGEGGLGCWVGREDGFLRNGGVELLLWFQD